MGTEVTQSTFQLYHADALDLMRSLPSDSVDMIATDIAYASLEKHRAVGTTTRLKKSAGSSNEWFPIFPNSRIPELMAECHRVLKKMGHFYFFCDDETKDISKPLAVGAGFTFWNELVWAKTKSAKKVDDLEDGDVSIGMGYHYRKSKEYILFFSKGKGRKLNNLGIGDVLPFPRVRNKYPTEKPYGLLCVLVEQSTVAGETVLDPFMGSAVAGAASVKLGRNFIGGDIKESAVVDGRERLLAAGGVELAPPIYMIRPTDPVVPAEGPGSSTWSKDLPPQVGDDDLVIPAEGPGSPTWGQVFGRETSAASPAATPHVYDDDELV